jgi:phage FluMu protein Com
VLYNGRVVVKITDLFGRGKEMSFCTYEDLIRAFIKLGYIDKDGKPLKCSNCKSINFEQFDEYMGCYGVEEYAIRCLDCGEVLGRWSYGNWQT